MGYSFKIYRAVEAVTASANTDIAPTMGQPAPTTRFGKEILTEARVAHNAAAAAVTANSTTGWTQRRSRSDPAVTGSRLNAKPTARIANASTANPVTSTHQCELQMSRESHGSRCTICVKDFPSCLRMRRFVSYSKFRSIVSD